MSYSNSSIILNSKNLVQNGFNNTLEMTFGGSSADFKNCEIALGKLYMNNSMFNINSSLYGNNTFQIKIPYGTTLTWYSLTITLDNGAYQYSDINTFIQNKLYAIGAYLIDSSGNYVYPIQIAANTVRYACQIDMAPANITLPTGWSYAASGLWSSSSGLPSTAYTPQIVIPSGISPILGISANTYPSAITTTSNTVLSDFTPQVSPIQSMLLRCSLINNRFNAAAPDVLTSFSDKGTDVGQLISVEPSALSWMTIPDQSVNKISVVIVDQDYRFVKLEDPKVEVEILIRTKLDD